ncbi:MAG: kynureninase [Chitinophagaceae bacterium]
MYTFENSLAFANKLDEEDLLKIFRDQFLHPNSNDFDRVYFLGNSLGLQPKTTKAAVQLVLDQWQQEGVESFFKGQDPWLNFHDKLLKQLAIIVGAHPHEITVMNQLTVNIHLMLVSFYRPVGNKNKILIESKAFPSDQYAIASYLRHIGLNPDDIIIEVNRENEGEPVSDEEIVEVINQREDELALVFLSGINYYTGQLFDLKAISKAAKSVGAMVGFDLAHAAGNVELKLHDWDIDFACWCSYKYLNAGPGAVGGVFVHEKHHHLPISRLEGWWGVQLEERFLMKKEFIPSPNATSWQLSTPPMLLLASLDASLKIIDSAGWVRLLEKQEKMIEWTDFLLQSIGDSLFRRITPARRGCQISLQFKKNGKEVYHHLFEKGFMIDWREPDVIRFAPVPLYNSFTEIWNFIQSLKEAVNELSLK